MRRLVVEADGGSRGNPGPAGYGALVRDGDTGALLVEVGESIPLATNNVAEYEGLIAGLKAAVAIDADGPVEVRMDSRLVVEQMSGRWSIKHEDMRRLAGVAREVIPGSRVTYTWISRAENGHADRLANAAMDAGAGFDRRMRLTPARLADPTGSAGTADRGPWAQGSGPRPSPVSLGGSWTAEAADLGEPTTLILVRHGRTDDTDQRRARGRGTAGPALNRPGRVQAERLARFLATTVGVEPDAEPDAEPGVERGAGPGAEASAFVAANVYQEALLGSRPTVIVTSPLLRARQTASALAMALDLECRVEDDWAELGLGDWDGLSYAEIAAGWPERYRDWRRSSAVAPPNGESLDDVAQRVGAAGRRLVAAYPGQAVVVVSHTAPIRSVLAQALTAGPAALWRLRIDPASISGLRFWADGGCEVAGVNSTAHLR